MCNEITREGLKNIITNYLRGTNVDRLEMPCATMQEIQFYDLIIIKANSVTVNDKVFQLQTPTYFVTFRRYDTKYSFQIVL